MEAAGEVLRLIRLLRVQGCAHPHRRKIQSSAETTLACGRQRRAVEAKEGELSGHTVCNDRWPHVVDCLATGRSGKVEDLDAPVSFCGRFVVAFLCARLEPLLRRRVCVRNLSFAPEHIHAPHVEASSSRTRSWLIYGSCTTRHRRPPQSCNVFQPTSSTTPVPSIIH